jgi:hypothetical protein
MRAGSVVGPMVRSQWSVTWGVIGIECRIRPLGCGAGGACARVADAMAEVFRARTGWSRFRSCRMHVPRESPAVGTLSLLLGTCVQGWLRT